MYLRRASNVSVWVQYLENSPVIMARTTERGA